MTKPGVTKKVPMIRQDISSVSPDGMRLALSISSVEVEVRRALVAVKQSMSDACLCDEDRGTVELVLGEVLNNVVEHAYGPRCKGSIELECTTDGNAIRIYVKDSGSPFPDQELPIGNPPNLDRPLEDLPEGGFGWFLVRSLAKELSYSRKNECNTLTFLIPLKESNHKG